MTRSTTGTHAGSHTRPGVAGRAPTPPARSLRPSPVIAPVSPTYGRLRPLGLDEVQITGGFWAERQLVNRDQTLPHIGHWLRREGWLGNFELAAAGDLPDGRRGETFADSEVYKYLEALAWEIGRADDPALETEFRGIVEVVAAAQDSDGYLHTNFGRPGQEPRWSDLEWGHELYCLGHLFQAAVARARTQPDSDDTLLQVATRAADLVCDVFGPDGLDGVCGHPEIEPALVELSRVTGERRYLDQAALFVSRRGTGTLRPIEYGAQYFQDDMPIAAANVLRGHAVRANYLSAGAVDVAVDTNEPDLLAALQQQWRHTTARRTYITGGQGSHHQDEGFGDDYELPPDRAYSETCAGVGSVMFGWRLLLADGDPDAARADLIERTLYNIIATSPSADGQAFYYANTLHQRVPTTAADPEIASPRAASSSRAPWFHVSCCPPNVARTLASLDTLLATVDEEGLQLHQYAPARIRTSLDDGRQIALDVHTEYPREGSVRLVVTEGTSRPVTISLRVPRWAKGAGLHLTTHDGHHSDLPAGAGWAQVRRTFDAGDSLELTLPLRPRITAPDRRVDAVRGCVAVERGPQVYCLESVDLAAATDGRLTDVADVVLDLGTPIKLVQPETPVARFVRRTDRHPAADWPYQDTRGPRPADSRSQPPHHIVDVPLVPYHAWAERGPSTMRVWLPLASAGAESDGANR